VTVISIVLSGLALLVSVLAIRYTRRSVLTAERAEERSRALLVGHLNQIVTVTAVMRDPSRTLPHLVLVSRQDLAGVKVAQVDAEIHPREVYVQAPDGTHVGVADLPVISAGEPNRLTVRLEPNPMTDGRPPASGWSTTVRVDAAVGGVPMTGTYPLTWEII